MTDHPHGGPGNRPGPEWRQVIAGHEHLVAVAVALAVIVMMAGAWLVLGRDHVPDEAPGRDIDLARQVERLLDRGGFQRALPDTGRDTRAPRAEIDVPRIPILADIVRLLIILLIAGAVVVLGVGLYRYVERRHRMLRGGSDGDSGGERSDTSGFVPAAANLEAADALARQGRYAEAMHSLLLATFADMRRWLQIGIADALTSREVVARVPMPAAARDALSIMVQGVEISLFGGRQADSKAWDACRESYRAFAAACGART